jgi:4-oxalmesaconate hydratase
MIIDCHGHYTTAPAALETWRKMQIDCGGDRAVMRGQGAPIIPDDLIRESLEKTQLRLQLERGIDLTIYSQRHPLSFSVPGQQIKKEDGQ